MRPKGQMIIVTALRSVKDVVWYLKLHQGLTERYMKIFPAVEQFLRMFNESGFECLTKINILGSEFLKDYYDGEGPLREDWRKSISLYGMASDEEIRETECFVRELRERGKLEEFLKSNDKTLDVSAFTLFVCVSE